MNPGSYLQWVTDSLGIDINRRLAVSVVVRPYGSNNDDRGTAINNPQNFFLDFSWDGVPFHEEYNPR